MTNTVATLGVDITVNERNPRALDAFEDALKSLDKTGERTGRSLMENLARSTQGSQRAATEALRLAQAQASGARAAGNNAEAVNILTRAMASYQQASDGSVRSLTLLQRVQNQVASAQRGDISSFAQLKDSLSGVSTVAQSLPGPLGAVTSGFAALGAAGAAVALASFVGDATQAAAALERTENVARAVAGSQEVYNELLATARQQQQLFGGSLQQNIQDLTGLASITKQTGASLADMTDIAQRLLTLDPSANATDAVVALREALVSGDTVSLAERFELPKSALAALRDQSISTTEKIQVLDTVLNQAGITTEAVAGSIPESTRALNALGAAFDDLKNRIGSTFAEVPTLFGNILLAAQDAQTAVQNVAITPQTDYTAYLAQLDAVRAKIEATFANDPAARALALQQAALTPLTPSMFAYAQSLAAAGVSQEGIAAAVQTSDAALTLFGDALIAANQASGELGSQLAALEGTFVAAASGSEANRAEAGALVEQWILSEGKAFDLQSRLTELSVAHVQEAAAADVSAVAARDKAAADEQAASAAAEHQQRIDEARAALVEETTAKLNSAAAAQNLASFQATLANLAGGVTSGFYSNEQAARTLAASYGIAYAEALKLISAQAALGQSDGRVAGIKGPASGGGPNGFGVTASTEQVKKIQEAKKAKREYEKATGDAATKQRILNEEVKIAEQRYGQYSQEAYRARQASEQNRQAMEREAAAAAKKNAKGGGGKGKGKAKTPGVSSTKLTDQQKLNNQIAADQQKADDAAEKAEREHRRRMTDIFKEYAEKMKQAERSLADAMYESRASFYRKVIDLKDADLQQKASAAYEAAVQNAAQIEKAQGADVAEAYLAEQEKIIAARAQREQEIRDLEKEGDTARAEALRGVDALEREAEDRRIARILEGQKSLKEQQQQALDEESANYATKQDEMATAADTAANRRVAAAQRAGKEIDAERVKVEQLQSSYAKVAASGRPATSAANPPAADPATVRPPVAATGDAATADADWRQQVLDRLDRIERAERDGARQVSSAVSNRQVV